MSTIHKKVWREYFEKIISGEKKFELRLADFEVNEGDTLVLEEWDEIKGEYTGRRVEVVATYILKTKGQTFWAPEEVEKYGFQIIQFEPKEEVEAEKGRQEAKEQAIRLALQKGMALTRRGLEIHGMKVDGSTLFLSKSQSYEKLWQDVLEMLREDQK